MTRAVADVLRIVRKEISKVQVVTAIVRERNYASQHVPEKSGFRRVGEHIGALSGTVVYDFELRCE
jgi:RimJ/RimL family protein N-acetyltransferase